MENDLCNESFTFALYISHHKFNILRHSHLFVFISEQYHVSIFGFFIFEPFQSYFISKTPQFIIQTLQVSKLLNIIRQFLLFPIVFLYLFFYHLFLNLLALQ